MTRLAILLLPRAASPILCSKLGAEQWYEALSDGLHT